MPLLKPLENHQCNVAQVDLTFIICYSLSLRGNVNLGLQTTSLNSSDASKGNRAIYLLNRVQFKDSSDVTDGEHLPGSFSDQEYGLVKIL